MARKPGYWDHGNFYTDFLHLRKYAGPVPLSPARKARRSGKNKRQKWLDRKYAAHQNFCVYCARGLLRKEMSVDHVVPLSKGGLDVEDNWAVSCIPCNNEKGDRDG